MDGAHRFGFSGAKLVASIPTLNTKCAFRMGHPMQWARGLEHVTGTMARNLAGCAMGVRRRRMPEKTNDEKTL
jgi:hypothetical protein